MVYFAAKTHFVAKVKITIEVNVKTMIQQIIRVVLRTALMGDQV